METLDQIAGRNRCATCRHAVQASDDWLTCTKPEVASKKLVNGDGILTDATSGSQVYVGPRFGCVHWEEKP